MWQLSFFVRRRLSRQIIQDPETKCIFGIPLTQDSHSLLEATELTARSQITLLYRGIADVAKEKSKMPRFDVMVTKGGTYINIFQWLLYVSVRVLGYCALTIYMRFIFNHLQMCMYIHCISYVMSDGTYNVHVHIRIWSYAFSPPVCLYVCVYALSEYAN